MTAPALRLAARAGASGVAIALLVLAPCRAPQDALASAEDRLGAARAWGSWLEAECRDKRVPAAVLTVVQGKRERFTSTFGSALGSGLPASERSVVRADPLIPLLTALAKSEGLGGGDHAVTDAAAHVLRRLRLDDTFLGESAPPARFEGTLRTPEGRRLPAGGAGGASGAPALSTTARDLAILTRALLSEFGQEPPLDSRFQRGALAGRTVFGAGGSVAGFTVALRWCPAERAGAALWLALEGAGPLAERIVDGLLQSALDLERHVPLTLPERTVPLTQAQARGASGLYGLGLRRLRLVAWTDRLYADREGVPVEVRARAAPEAGSPPWIVDDVAEFGTPVEVKGGGLDFGGERWSRLEDPRPEPVPEAWHSLLGAYGDDDASFVVFERFGALQALLDRWHPARGTLRAGDQLQLERLDATGVEEARLAWGADGSILGVHVRGLWLPKARFGSASRVKPIVSVRALLDRVRREEPPPDDPSSAADDWVELSTLDRSLVLDLRYATPDNFLGEPLYRRARAFLQRPAAEALVKAHRSLARAGLGIAVLDAYRPWFVTKAIHDAVPESFRGFVADPARGSRHNRGCAVDATLFERSTGRLVEMPSAYDEASPRAYTLYPGGTERERWHRDRLRSAMEDAGFAALENEWWHFDFAGWRAYAISNIDFDEIRK